MPGFTLVGSNAEPTSARASSLGVADTGRGDARADVGWNSDEFTGADVV